MGYQRSTNLDSWQLGQLRTMKVGGNASATDFFTKNAGATLVNDADTKKKYHHPAAELYRAELAQRVAQDAQRFPAGIWVEGMAEAAPAAAKAGGDDDDFFDSWDKPEASKPTSAPTSTATSPPPMLGRAPVAATGPRTVTSSSLRSTSGTSAARPALGASRLGSTTSSLSSSAPPTPGGGSAPKKGKLGGLGAKKSAPVDFASVEKAAQEDAKRAAEAEAARKAAEAEAARKQEEAAAAAAKTSAPLKSPAVTSPAAGKPATPGAATAAPPGKKAAGNEQDMARLGMGMKKLAFASAPQAAPKKN
jgi:ADP-ribosylation factor GTPase-activating protein 2/3